MDMVMFQFLIGTLKTDDLSVVIQRIAVFQFLIGTLKTQEKNLPTELPTNVSIPHRYAKNQIRLRPYHRCHWSFNSS